MSDLNPLNHREVESNKATMARMEQHNADQTTVSDKAKGRMKDEAKDVILSQMDQIIPRSERMAITGKSRMFSFPKLYK